MSVQISAEAEALECGGKRCATPLWIAARKMDDRRWEIDARAHHPSANFHPDPKRRRRCALPCSLHESPIPKGLCPPAQGCSCLATLGFEPESLWDSPGSSPVLKMRVRSRRSAGALQKNAFRRSCGVVWKPTASSLVRVSVSDSGRCANFFEQT